MNLLDLFKTMTPVAMGVAGILVIMSMWSFGVAIERYYTFSQARKQSKLYAPQVAKHLKEGRLKDALSVSQAKTYQYSHLAKVVLSGLQEFQFQQEAGGSMERGDIVDTVRRAIQRATALTSNDLKKGIPSLRDHRDRRRRSSGLLESTGRPASSTRSPVSRPPDRAASAPCRPVSRKRSSRPRSASSSPSRRCGCTTTSRIVSSRSASRWTTHRRNSWITSSRRRRRSSGPWVREFRDVLRPIHSAAARQGGC